MTCTDRKHMDYQLTYDIVFKRGGDCGHKGRREIT